MRVRYTAFDPAHLAGQRLDQLRSLFLQLLMHSGGDVERALKWLDDVAKRYGLWDEDLDLEQFKDHLLDEGLITAERRPGKGGKREPRQRLHSTRKAERAIRQDAFEHLFSAMKQDHVSGDHLTPFAGGGGEALPELRRFEFGDRFQDIDIRASISNSLLRAGNLDMTEDDLMVHEVEHATSCATVIALDISHSMTLYGEDRMTPAKRVALAMTELIQTKFPKDSLDVLVFGDEAVQIDPRELAYIQNGPYHTNTKGALDLGAGLLERRKHQNKQIILITDGKPSAMNLGSRIVNHTVEAAQRCRRKGIIITTFMIASDPYLREFVERMTQANSGRAYYSDLENLGKFVLEDFVANRRRIV
jgi:uncharacterized protein with von Willebrand factor type A (vWA) domain